MFIFFSSYFSLEKKHVLSTIHIIESSTCCSSMYPGFIHKKRYKTHCGCLIQIMKNVTLRQVALNEIMIEIIAHMERIDTKSVSLRELMQSVV